MSESLKGLARDEVAARRAALTDGRWRNREGIGMYQRSTSNALRNILTGVKGAFPSLSRARSKSRSRSISPKKRAALVAENHSESRKADPSPLRPSPSPARSTRSRRSSIRSRKNSSAAGASISLLSPRAFPSPARRPNPSPLRKSYLSPLRRSRASPIRESDHSPTRPSNPSPLRQSHPSPARSPVPFPGRKPSTARQKPQAKSKSELKFNKGKEPEPSVPDSPQERRANVQEAETPEDDDVPQDGSPLDEVEDEPLAVPEPEPEPEPDAVRQDEGNGVDESMVVFQDDPLPKVPKGKEKEKAKSRTQEDTVADESVVILEEQIPELPPPKKKSRIQTIVPGVVQRQNPAQSRKASGSKRPAADDDDERAEGSPPKRAKSNKSKPKAKAPAKKGKTTKGKSRKKAEASRAISVESEPEPTRATPAPQDIMVPLQDSPPPRPKDSKQEMSHPDYDPIDCIGWQ
ncbi:hypothetical protein B0J17DRAFT_665099 [Rhizoctonia solani]|nr:hypothetical protein B0J17DRAFT_665099 [Rhizoctonia solani]